VISAGAGGECLSRSSPVRVPGTGPRVAGAVGRPDLCRRATGKPPGARTGRDVLNVLRQGGPSTAPVKAPLRAPVRRFLHAETSGAIVLVAIVVGQRGLPRRHITAMYAAWGFASLALAVYTLVTASWQAMVIAGFAEGGWTAGELVWVSMLQRFVPRELLGRVKSLDWLLSIGLAPVGFALCGPVAAWLGVDAVLIIAGVGAFALTVGFYFLPGMRDTERDGHELRVVLGSAPDSV